MSYLNEGKSPNSVKMMEAQKFEECTPGSNKWESRQKISCQEALVTITGEYMGMTTPRDLMLDLEKHKDFIRI